METNIESIVRIDVISHIGSVVKKMNDKEITYQITMSFARKVLENGLITNEEYRDFNSKMIEKYSPEIGLLIADIDLIKCGYYGNM